MTGATYVVALSALRDSSLRPPEAAVAAQNDPVMGACPERATAMSSAGGPEPRRGARSARPIIAEVSGCRKRLARGGRELALRTHAVEQAQTPDCRCWSRELLTYVPQPLRNRSSVAIHVPGHSHRSCNVLFSPATPCHPERRGAGRNEPRDLVAMACGAHSHRATQHRPMDRACSHRGEIPRLRAA